MVMIASASRTTVSNFVSVQTNSDEHLPRWLLNVSESGLQWTIAGGLRAADDQSLVDFDISLPDGSALAESAGGSLLEMAMAYAVRFRIVNPESTSGTHRRRISDLLTFFCWMNLHHISALSRLTPDHIELFASKLAYGSEWALEIPHRLIRCIGKTFAAGEGPRMMPRYRHRIARGAIYQAIHENQNRAHPYPMSSAVLDWYDADEWEIEHWNNVELVLAKAGVRPKLRTWSALQQSLLPLDELYLWRRYLPGNSLNFVPFPKGTHAIARTLGVETERTPTIPPKLAFEFLAMAIWWVIDVAPIVQGVHEGKLSRDECEAKLNALGIEVAIQDSPWVKISTFRRDVSAEGLLRLLAAACFAVIAGLSARRLEEIKDLGAGCVTEDSEGQCWITIYIEKTLRRYELIPVPKIIKMAVECLELLSKEAREKSASDSIWQTTRNGDVVPLHGEMFLDELAILGGRLADEWAGAWSFSAHQFRRFFAMIYFWRYDRGELGALSHHLRHYDLEMTKRYVTDTNGRRIFSEIAGLWRAALLRDIVAGRKSIGGIAGSRLKAVANKLMQQLRKVIDVVTPEKVAARLLRLTDRLGVEFRQHVWGTICACPSKTRFASLARCKGERRHGPVFKNATEDLCANCPFAVHTERFARATALAVERRASSCIQPQALLQELSKIQIVALEEAVERGDAMPLFESIGTVHG